MYALSYYIHYGHQSHLYSRFILGAKGKLSSGVVSEVKENIAIESLCCIVRCNGLATNRVISGPPPKELGHRRPWSVIIQGGPFGQENCGNNICPIVSSKHGSPANIWTQRYSKSLLNFSGHLVPQKNSPTQHTLKVKYVEGSERSFTRVFHSDSAVCPSFIQYSVSTYNVLSRSCSRSWRLCPLKVNIVSGLWLSF